MKNQAPLGTERHFFAFVFQYVFEISQANAFSMHFEAILIYIYIFNTAEQKESTLIIY